MVQLTNQLSGDLSFTDLSVKWNKWGPLARAVGVTKPRKFNLDIKIDKLQLQLGNWEATHKSTNHTNEEVWQLLTNPKARLADLEKEEDETVVVRPLIVEKLVLRGLEGRIERLEKVKNKQASTPPQQPQQTQQLKERKKKKPPLNIIFKDIDVKESTIRFVDYKKRKKYNIDEEGYRDFPLIEIAQLKTSNLILRKRLNAILLHTRFLGYTTLPLHCTALHCTITTLHCTALHYTTLTITTLSLH